MHLFIDPISWNADVRVAPKLAIILRPLDDLFVGGVEAVVNLP
jgi:hypothetical protein